MVYRKAKVTAEHHEPTPGLVNGTTVNDLDRSTIRVSRSRHKKTNRWPAWWNFVFSGNLPQCCVLIVLLYCGLFFFLRRCAFAMVSCYFNVMKIPYTHATYCISLLYFQLRKCLCIPVSRLTSRKTHSVCT